MNIYLISFGNHKYEQQKKNFEATAVASGFFDNIRIFSPADISPGFSNRVNDVLQAARGGGYWIWKPYFMKGVLDSLRKDEILVYCDAGCLINSRGKDRFYQYVDMLVNSETGTVDFELPFKEFEYTKQEVFDYLKAREDIVQSNQLMATVLMVRKCKHSELLINEWYATACNNPQLFSDQLTSLQYEKFIDHRHDQSVFSVIRKQHGFNAVADETYFKDFLKDGDPYPFWATRLKG